MDPHIPRSVLAGFAGALPSGFVVVVVYGFDSAKEAFDFGIEAHDGFLGDKVLFKSHGKDAVLLAGQILKQHEQQIAAQARNRAKKAVAYTFDAGQARLWQQWYDPSQMFMPSPPPLPSGLVAPERILTNADGSTQMLMAKPEPPASPPLAVSTQPVETTELADVVRFSCTSCHSKLRSKPKYAGKQVKCPKCGEAVRIPEQSPVSEAAAARTASPSCAEGVQPDLLKLPILSHDFENWRVTHKERGVPVPAFDAEQITNRQNRLSGKQASKLMESGEWQIRTFSLMWSRALQEQVPIETIECLCRYEFNGPRRTITRLFRYGEDTFATINEVG